MKGTFTAISVFLLFFIAAAILLIHLARKESSAIGDAFDHIDKVDKILLTSRVIIKKDTLDIVSTNWLKQQVTLENGKVYDYNYIEPRFELGETKRKIDSINNLLKQ